MDVCAVCVFAVLAASFASSHFAILQLHIFAHSESHHEKKESEWQKWALISIQSGSSICMFICAMCMHRSWSITRCVLSGKLLFWNIVLHCECTIAHTLLLQSHSEFCATMYALSDHWCSLLISNDIRFDTLSLHSWPSSEYTFSFALFVALCSIFEHFVSSLSLCTFQPLLPCIETSREWETETEREREKHGRFAQF